MFCLGYSNQTSSAELTSVDQQFVFVPFVFQHDLHRALTSTPSNTLGMNWNANCEPGLITQHQCWISLMLLWLNGSQSLQPGSKIWWKPEEWRLLQQQINVFAVTCSAITYRCMFACLHSFGLVLCVCLQFQHDLNIAPDEDD